MQVRFKIMRNIGIAFLRMVRRCSLTLGRPRLDAALEAGIR
jgi:hypothetical protein